jgi:hypothetical protein
VASRTSVSIDIAALDGALEGLKKRVEG